MKFINTLIWSLQWGLIPDLVISCKDKICMLLDKGSNKTRKVATIPVSSASELSSSFTKPPSTSSGLIKGQTTNFPKTCRLQTCFYFDLFVVCQKFDTCI